MWLEEERARAHKAMKMAEEATKKAEAKVVKAVELWRASSEFNALAQDAYVVAFGRAREAYW